jgi:hypothetical protein
MTLDADDIQAIVDRLAEMLQGPVGKPHPVLVSRKVGASLLGFSLSHWERHHQDDFELRYRVVYSGQLKRYFRDDLVAYAEGLACRHGRAA